MGRQTLIQQFAALPSVNLRWTEQNGKPYAATMVLQSDVPGASREFAALAAVAGKLLDPDAHCPDRAWYAHLAETFPEAVNCESGTEYQNGDGTEGVMRFLEMTNLQAWSAQAVEALPDEPKTLQEAVTGFYWEALRQRDEIMRAAAAVRAAVGDAFAMEAAADALNLATVEPMALRIAYRAADRLSLGMPVVNARINGARAAQDRLCGETPENQSMQAMMEWHAPAFVALQSVIVGDGTPTADKRPVENRADARHSDDFASVNWWGTAYTFTTNQAAVVKVLWKAWENGTPTMGEPEILDQAGIETPLRVVFQGHPAWRKLVTSPQRGRFSLLEPEISTEI